jgi:hypothetical protein
VLVAAPARMLVLGALLAIVPACSTPPAPAPGSSGIAPDVTSHARDGPLDDTLRAALGRSTSADKGRLVLTFNARLSDSRCPADVVCVWMGDAAVRISAQAGRTSVDGELHTGLEPRSLSIGGYVVSLLGLTPYPGTGDSSTPTAILRVVKQ